MAMDVAADVLNDPDFLIDLTRVREVAGAYVDGIFNPGGTQELSFKGSVQPMGSDDFVNYGEGEREEGAQVVYTITELRGSKDTTNFDRIKNLKGANWKVKLVEDWSEYGYYKAMIVRLEEGQ